MFSGLYDDLSGSRLLVPLKDANIVHTLSYDAYKLIEPETVDLISYPYEWSFSQFKLPEVLMCLYKIDRHILKRDD